MSYESIEPLLADYLDPPTVPVKPPRPEKPPPAPGLPPGPGRRRGVLGRARHAVANFFGRVLGRKTPEDQQADRLYAERVSAWEAKVKDLEDRYGRQLTGHANKLNRWEARGVNAQLHVTEHYFREQWLPPGRMQPLPGALMAQVIRLWRNNQRFAGAEAFLAGFLREYNMPNVQLWVEEAVIDKVEIEER